MKPLIKPIRHIYEWPEIVIGNNLNALLYAYKNKSHIIINSKFTALFYDESDEIIVLDFLGWDKGENLETICNQIKFQLGFYGLRPFSDICQIFIESDKNLLKVMYKARTININYESLKLFSTENVHGIPFEYEVDEHYRVIDFIRVRGVKKEQTFDKIIYDRSNDFVTKIVPYEGRTLACESLISVDNIQNIDYAPSMARLKANEMLTNAGYCRSTNEAVYVKFLRRDKYLIQNLTPKKEGNIEIL